MRVSIPGWGELCVEHIVFDYNGTLAVDGRLGVAVRERLTSLVKKGFHIYVITADTFGLARGELAGLSLALEILAGEDTAAAKARFIHRLGPECVAAVGNGRNDEAMVRAAALGIAILGREGCHPGALAAADIAVADINDALDLFLCPKRLVATLRG